MTGTATPITAPPFSLSSFRGAKRAETVKKIYGGASCYGQPRLQGCKVARLQGCKVARLQGCKLARLQGCKVARLQDCKVARLQTARLQGFGASWARDLASAYCLPIASQKPRVVFSMAI